MKWYFVGECRSYTEMLLEEGVKSILVSYAYFKKQLPEKLVAAKKAGKVNVMLDSGAFTNEKKPGHVNMTDYIAYLKEHKEGLSEYVMMDEIGNPKGTVKNYHAMREAGLKPLFVDHVNKPPNDDVRKLVYKSGGKLCWGGIASRETMRVAFSGDHATPIAERGGKIGQWIGNRIDWVRKSPVSQLHLLGVGLRLHKIREVLDVVDSFDSATWVITTGSYGKVMWIEETDDGWPKMKSKHFSEAPDNVRSYAKKHGLNMADWRDRNRLGIRMSKVYYQKLEAAQEKAVKQRAENPEPETQTKKSRIFVPGFSFAEDQIPDEAVIIRTKASEPAGDMFGADYFADKREHDLPFSVKMAEVLKAVESGSVLEMGSGMCRAQKVLRESGHHVHGVDISKVAVTEGISAGFDVFRLDATKLPFSDGSYDTVFSMDTLECIPSAERAIGESIRVARKKAVHLIPLGHPSDDALHSWPTLDEFKDWVEKTDAVNGSTTNKFLVGEVPGKEIQHFGVLVIDKQEPETPSEEVIKSAGGLSFVEGDSGTGILQTHERGLTKELATGDSMGWSATQSDLPEDFSVHTDVRLVRKDDDHWEGGEAYASPDPKSTNLFLDVAAGKELEKGIQMNLRSPDGPVIRGPLGWIRVGKGRPQVFPPGATRSGYTRYHIKDEFIWKAGVQKPTFKEFHFDGAVIKGRWCMGLEPDGNWTLYRPVDQTPESEALRKELETTEVQKSYFCPIVHVEKQGQKRLITGIVLQPEVVDAQGDIISAEEIELAAHDFLKRYNAGTKIGVMHRDYRYKKRFELAESWISPISMQMGGREVKVGSWLAVVHVLDDAVWKQVLAGKLNGFSIKGTARARQP